MESLAFVAQAAVAGLAVAFVVVLAKPDLIADAVQAASRLRSELRVGGRRSSAPAVANIYTTINRAEHRHGMPVVEPGLGSGVIMRPARLSRHQLARDSRGGPDPGAARRRARRRGPKSSARTRKPSSRCCASISTTCRPVRLGRSDRLEVGEVVLAIGNSLGLSQTVTMGIVSATGRGQLGVTTFEDFIQTDAAINAGNSGGALINARGELVGINTAVLSASLRDHTAPEGIGFAIPVNLVRGVMTQLIENGRVIRGYLGVEGTRPARRARRACSASRVRRCGSRKSTSAGRPMPRDCFPATC